MAKTARRPRRSSRIVLVQAFILVGLGLAVLVSVAGAQVPGVIGNTPTVPEGEGWQGFTEWPFLLHASLNLILAAVLGAIIAYHPRRVRTADTLEEIQAPKVTIVYAVMGSLIGILVVKYSYVIGFVLFGIGGLIRFRTVMRSAQLTGQVIFATLIGLTCGVNLPHVAVLAAAFDFVLTFILEARVTFQLDVLGLPLDRYAEAAAAYRAVLAGGNLRVLSETKRPEKGRLSFIFRCGGRDPCQRIEELVQEGVDQSLRGSLDWEVD